MAFFCVVLFLAGVVFFFFAAAARLGDLLVDLDRLLLVALLGDLLVDLEREVLEEREELFFLEEEVRLGDLDLPRVAGEREREGDLEREREDEREEDLPRLGERERDTDRERLFRLALVLERR